MSDSEYQMNKNSAVLKNIAKNIVEVAADNCATCEKLVFDLDYTPAWFNSFRKQPITYVYASSRKGLDRYGQCVQIDGVLEGKPSIDMQTELKKHITQFATEMSTKEKPLAVEMQRGSLLVSFSRGECKL